MSQPAFPEWELRLVSGEVDWPPVMYGYKGAIADCKDLIQHPHFIALRG